MSEIRLVGNQIPATPMFGHFQIVYVDSQVETEIEVQAKDIYPFNDPWQFSMGNHRFSTNYNVEGKYAFQTIDLGDRNPLEIWNQLVDLHFQFAAHSSNFSYDDGYNSNTYAATILNIVGINISDYRTGATPDDIFPSIPLSDHGFPGSDVIATEKLGDAFSLDISGTNSNDIFRGSIVGDTIRGGIGQDRIGGKAGNDLIEGGADDDTLYGDEGVDIYQFSGLFGNDVIWDQEAAIDPTTANHGFTGRLVFEGINPFGNDNYLKYNSVQDGSDLRVWIANGGNVTIKNYFADNHHFEFVFTENSQSYLMALNAENRLELVQSTDQSNQLEIGEWNARFPGVSFDANYDYGATGFYVTSADAVLEGKDMVFYVHRLGDIDSRADSVGWYISRNGANIGSSDDFEGVEAGSVHFAKGEIVKEIRVSTRRDATDEAREEFFLNLRHTDLDLPSYASAPSKFSDQSGRVIDFDKNDEIQHRFAIINDGPFSADEYQVLISSNGSVREGDGRPLTYTVERTGGIDHEAEFRYRLLDETGNRIDGADFLDSPEGTLRFAVGQQSAQLSFRVVDDALVEGNETYSLQVLEPRFVDLPNVTFADPAPATIIDDDEAPTTFTITNAPTINEGASGAALNFEITRSGGVSTEQRIGYELIGPDGAVGTGGDVYGEATGFVTFAPDQTTATVSFAVRDDSIDEGSGEQFTLQLANGATATGYIQDDDAPEPVLAPDLVVENVSLSAVTVTYGDILITNWEVLNQGSGGADASHAGIYLSLDDQIDSSDRLLTSKSTSRLDPDERDADGAAVVVAEDIAPGSYYVGVIADYQNEVPGELQEGNNSSGAVALTVQGNEPIPEPEPAPEPQPDPSPIPSPSPPPEVIAGTFESAGKETPLNEVLEAIGLTLNAGDQYRFDFLAGHSSVYLTDTSGHKYSGTAIFMGSEVDEYTLHTDTAGRERDFNIKLYNSSPIMLAEVTVQAPASFPEPDMISERDPGAVLVMPESGDIDVVVKLDKIAVADLIKALGMTYDPDGLFKVDTRKAGGFHGEVNDTDIAYSIGRSMKDASNIFVEADSGAALETITLTTYGPTWSNVLAKETFQIGGTDYLPTGELAAFSSSSLGELVDDSLIAETGDFRLLRRTDAAENEPQVLLQLKGESVVLIDVLDFSQEIGIDIDPNDESWATGDLFNIRSHDDLTGGVTTVLGDTDYGAIGRHVKDAGAVEIRAEPEASETVTIKTYNTGSWQELTDLDVLLVQGMQVIA